MWLFDHARPSRQAHRSARRVLGTRLLIASLITVAVLPFQHNGAWTARADVNAAAPVVTSGTLTKVGVVDPRALARQAQVAPTTAAPSRNLGALLLPRPASMNAAVQPPGAASAALTSSSSGIAANFLGLTSVDSRRVNGYNVEPPDQALCVSHDFVMQQVNLAAALYTKTGALVAGPVSENAFYDEGSGGFSTPFNLSDPRCYYDRQANAWFAEIWESNFSDESHIDLAVNPTSDPTTPWTIYRLDTTNILPSAGCPCFPDYTMIGTDAHGVFLSSNNFTLQPYGNFAGVSVVAVSKAQLLAGAASVHTATYTGLVNGGEPAFNVQPATSPTGSGYSAGTEYFLDSLQFNENISNRIGVWALGNDAVLDSGGNPTLSNLVVQTEVFVEPLPIVQKGSDATLNPDDVRILQPVQNVNGTLWASLNTAVLIPNDLEPRDGAAWFRIVPTVTGGTLSSVRLSTQGYVALLGNYLSYPAIAVVGGKPAMVLSLSGASYFPSVAYATGLTFSTLHIAAAGTQPDIGFTCAPPFGPPCRWGDYAAAAQDVGSGNVWLSTMYIAGPGDGISNWANRIVEVTP